MTEEITIQPTAAELGVSVRSIPQGYTASARYGAERNDGKPTVSLAALLELLGSKKIPPLDSIQMMALLHYLFKEAERPLRFQVAELVYRHDHDHPNAQDLFLACILPSGEKAARRKAEKLFFHPSDWQVELMYDGAVAAAIEMFQLNAPLSFVPISYLLSMARRGSILPAATRFVGWHLFFRSLFSPAVMGPPDFPDIPRPAQLAAASCAGRGIKNVWEPRFRRG